MVGVSSAGGMTGPVDVAEAEPGRLGIVEENLTPGRIVGRGGEGDGAGFCSCGLDMPLHDEVAALGAFVGGISVDEDEGAGINSEGVPDRDISGRDGMGT